MKTGVDLIARERKNKANSLHFDMSPTFKSEDLVKMAAAMLLSNPLYAPDHWHKDVIAQLIRMPRTNRIALAGAYIAAALDKMQNGT
jgi:hypothetical protein